MTVDEFWKKFLLDTGRSSDTEYLESFSFGMTEELANDLLKLVLSGQKWATSSSLWAYEIENERIPQVGDFSIVTDWEGKEVGYTFSEEMPVVFEDFKVVYEK